MIPDNPIILVSFLNTKLRDCYNSLEALIDDLDLDYDELIQKLKMAGFFYDQDSNQFKKINE